MMPSNYTPAEQAAFKVGFGACLNALELTGADMLDDAIEEAQEAFGDLPWPEEDEGVTAERELAHKLATRQQKGR